MRVSILLGTVILFVAYGFWLRWELGFGRARFSSRGVIAQFILQRENRPEVAAALRNPDSELIAYLGSIVKREARAYRYESTLYQIQNIIPDRIKCNYRWNRSPSNLRFWALSWLQAYWHVPGEAGDKASQVMVELLNYPKDEVRSDTLTSFYACDSTQRAGMLTNSSVDADVNLAAHSRVARALVARLEHEKGQRKHDAIYAVASLKCSTNWLVEPLVKILHDRDESCRRLAALRLSELGVCRKEMIPPLLKGMQDSAPLTSIRFIQALGSLGLFDATVRQALLIASTNNNAEVSSAAQDALRKMDPEAAKRTGIQ